VKYTYIVVGKYHGNILEVNQFSGSKRKWNELKNKLAKEFKKLLIIRPEDIPKFLNAEQDTKRRNHIFKAHKQTANAN